MTLPFKTAFLSLVSILSAILSLHGQISPSGYTYSVNPSGSYPDSGGELTDGTASVTAWPNSTTGAAFAGWNYTNPTFTLNFSSTEKITEIRVWAADSDGSAGVALPSSITLSTSDGFSKNFTVTNPSGSGNSISINLQGFCIISNNVTVTVHRDASQHWTMLSEVQVFGPGSGNINLGSTSHEFHFGTNNNLSNVISGTGGSINKTGSSTLTLEGNNTNTGGITITDGTIKLGHNNAAGTGNISILGGNIGARGTLDFNGFNLSNNITLSNLGTGVNTEGIIQNTNTSAASTLSGTLTIGGENYVGGNGDLIISGLVSGGSNSTYSIFKQGTGTWKFSNNNNTFDGFYYQTAGTTEVTSLANINTASALGRPTNSTANRVVFGYSSQNGTLRFVGSAACSSDRAFIITGSSGNTHKIEGSGSASSATLTLSGNVSINNSSAQSIVLGGNNAGENTFSGAIQNGSGTLTLLKDGSTTWILTGTNTYTGSTTITSGTLKVGNGGSGGELGGNGAIANSGTLEINKSSNLTLSRIIQGTGNFTHSGTGVTTLSSTNTYTGSTSVTQGELKVNGSIASSSQLSVSSGAIVSGTGILPTSTISGIHSPGNSPGLQTVNGNLTYTNGSSVTWELISNSIGTRGTDYDGIDVNGNLDFSGTTTINITFNTAGSAVNWNNSFWSTAKTGTNGWKIYEVASGQTISNISNLILSVSSNWRDINNATLASLRPQFIFALRQVGQSIYLTYEEAPLSGFTISSISSGTANTPITGVTVTAVNVNNHTISSFRGSVTFSGTAGITGTSGYFQSGVLSGLSITPINSGTGLTFVVTDSLGNTGTTSFTVGNPAPNYTVVSFKNTGTTSWSAPSFIYATQALIVAGGGAGGGRDIAGGGGAGGVIFNPNSYVTAGSNYTVTVGAGGAGADDARGAKGGNSSFNGDNADGGGAGSYYTTTLATSGGSGGGGSAASGATAGASGVANEGNNGGNGSSSFGTSGGGGGAGAIGGNGASGVCGSGGVGLHQKTISGTTYNFYSLFGTSHGGEVNGGQLYFGGGGGGSSHRNNTTYTGGAGGLGGGGTGVTTPNTRPSSIDALPNTGGGGGASKSASSPHYKGGNGGSGVIILRYGLAEIGQNGPHQYFSGVYDQAINIRKKDTNTVYLTGSNTYVGGTSVSAGSLILGDGNTSGSISTSSTINVSSGAFFGVNRSDNVTVANSITGTGGFKHIGTGNTTFTTDKTYTGPTIISAGTLILGGAAGKTASNGTITIENEGTMRLDRTDIWGAHNTSTTPGITLKQGGTLSSNNTFNTLINLNFQGGTLTTNGGVSSTFPSFALKGTIAVSGDGSQINSTGAGSHNTIAIGTGSAGGTATFNVADGNAYSDLAINVPLINFNGSASQLAKSGLGLLKLTAANTYTGTTTINEGSVEVDGSITSAITMAAAGTIGGKGTVTTISLQGTISPGGNDAGKLTTGNITLTGNSVVRIDLADVTSTPSIGWDLLQVNGTLALGTHQTIVNVFGTPNNFDFLQLYSWKIIAATNITGFNISNFSVNASGVELYTGNAEWTIEKVNNDIFLKFTPKSIVFPGVGPNTNVITNYTISSGNTLIAEVGAPIDYLVVGGGGSGAGRDVGGGGGGGGVVSNLRAVSPSPIYLSAGNYSITVGAGAQGLNYHDGVSGQNSLFGSIKAFGGGGGGYYASYTAPLGGSGGGGGRQGYFGGPGINGQGFAGGNGSNGTTSAYDAGGGGGGAGGPGSTAVKGTASTIGRGGNGGPGVQINFTGVASYFGGGGGGAPHRGSSTTMMLSGSGGIGGGGNAATNNASAPQSGTANTGGGGGASRSLTGSFAIGGNGGSGIVQVRYPSASFATGGTISSGTGTASGYTIHSFTSTGNHTFTIPSAGLQSIHTGNITGAGNFEYNSGGTLVFSSSSTHSYTGSTTIKAGNLRVNTSIVSSSSVTVNAAAELSGTGTLPVTTINGTHSPGSSPGLQTFVDGLTYNTGSQLNWELNGNTSGTRGTDFDAVDVTGGTLTIQSGVSSNLIFNSAGSTVDWTNSFWNSDHSWLVFDNANTPTTVNSAIFSTISVSADINNISLNNAAGRKSAYFYWSKTGNDIYLNYVAIAPAVTWTGSVSTDWGNPANWSPTVLPSSSTDVTIPNVANDPVVTLGPADPATAKDITLHSGAVLTINSGKVLNASGNVQLTGNLSNVGTLSCSGTLTLDGSSAQTLAGTLTLNNLTINNSAGVTLNTSINATGTLTMTSGNLTLGSYNATFTDVSGGNSSSYVKTSGSGQLNTVIASAASLTLPVGNSAYNPVTITNNSGAGDNFSLRVVDIVYYKGLDGSAGPAQEPHVTRTWVLGKSNPNSGSGIDLTFGWNIGELSSPAPTSFALYAFNGGTNKWDKLSGSSVSGNTLTFTGYTGSVGLFAIGDDIIALPIPNLRLSATLKLPNVLVEWINPDDVKVNFYTLQHSTNTQQWKTLVQQSSTGKGKYTFMHLTPESGINYYRILASNRNQQTDTSGMVVAIGQKPDAAFIYPNPATQGVLHCNLTEPSVAALFNSSGKLVWKKELPEGPSMLDVGHLPAGAYCLQLSGQTVTVLIP